MRAGWAVSGWGAIDPARAVRAAPEKAVSIAGAPLPGEATKTGVEESSDRAAAAAQPGRRRRPRAARERKETG